MQITGTAVAVTFLTILSGCNRNPETPPTAAQSQAPVLPATTPSPTPLATRMPEASPAPSVKTPAKEATPPAESAFKPAPVAEAPRPAPVSLTIPAGTPISVRINETLNSEQNHAGDVFSGTLTQAVVAGGRVIANRGAGVDGRLVESKRAGRVKGVADLSLVLTRITAADGQQLQVATDHYIKKGPDSTKGDVGKVAIASGIGAAIGAIAGHGKGAAIGAGAGAAAGTGAVLAMRGKPAEIRSESVIEFRLTAPATFSERRRN